MSLWHSFHVYSFYCISGLSLEKMLVLPSQNMKKKKKKRLLLWRLPKKFSPQTDIMADFSPLSRH